MKCQIVLLLLGTLTAFVSSNDASSRKINVKELSDGIELSCGDDCKIFSPNGKNETAMTLNYKDENTGEYTAVVGNTDKADSKSKIYVKFRTCDNCVDLDLASIAGLTIGDVLATVVIGAAVYLVASQVRTGSVTSHKSSDRQHLVPNEGSSRSNNDHYQSLRRKGQRDVYDKLRR